MDITRALEVAENVILKLTDRLQQVGHVLILLDIPNHLGGLGPLIEVDQFGRCERRYSIFDEGQIREVDT